MSIWYGIIVGIHKREMEMEAGSGILVAEHHTHSHYVRRYLRLLGVNGGVWANKEKKREIEREVVVGG